MIWFNGNDNKEVKFNSLNGETLVSIEGLAVRSEEVKFKTASGKEFIMLHYQDCCESVDVDDICGDIGSILNSPILNAEESTSENFDEEEYESNTWTFYKIDTAKGGVTIKWLGSSNGFYSESVIFEEVKHG